MESPEIHRNIFSLEEDSEKAAISDTKPAVGSPSTDCKYGKKHRRVPKRVKSNCQKHQANFIKFFQKLNIQCFIWIYLHSLEDLLIG